MQFQPTPNVTYTNPRKTIMQCILSNFILKLPKTFFLYTDAIIADLNFTPAFHAYSPYNDASSFRTLYGQ